MARRFRPTAGPRRSLFNALGPNPCLCPNSEGAGNSVRAAHSAISALPNGGRGQLMLLGRLRGGIVVGGCANAGDSSGRFTSPNLYIK